jgi:hypothetical protein
MIELAFDEDKINKYLDKLPILARKSFLSYKSDDFGWFYNNDFILPFYIKKKIIFKRLFFTTALISISNNNSIEDKKNFLNEMILSAKKLKIDIIDIPMVNAIFDCFPDGSITANFGTYIVDLSLNEDQILANIHSKHRNVIRKAEKDGVSIENGSKYIDECYKIISDTYKRQNKIFIDKNEFYRMYKFLNDNISFYIALKNNEVQGCAVLLWNTGNYSYYLFGGSKISSYAGSMNLLHYKAMLDMKQRGVKYYDFFGARINPDEGSKLEGIQRFKSRFGGEFIKGYLWKYPIKKFKYHLLRFIYMIMAIIKFQKYDGDLIDVESRKSKSKNDFDI